MSHVIRCYLDKPNAKSLGIDLHSPISRRHTQEEGGNADAVATALGPPGSMHPAAAHRAAGSPQRHTGSLPSQGHKPLSLQKSHHQPTASATPQHLQLLLPAALGATQTSCSWGWSHWGTAGTTAGAGQQRAGWVIPGLLSSYRWLGATPSSLRQLHAAAEEPEAAGAWPGPGALEARGSAGLTALV